MGTMEKLYAVMVPKVQFNRDKLYLAVIIPIPYISLYEIKPSKEKRINAAIYNCIDKLW